MSEIILMSDARVAAIPVRESGEPLVDVRGALLVDDRKHGDSRGAEVHLRRGVLDRLLAAQARLPDGLRLLFVEGYRPPALQRSYFERYAAELRAEHPHWPAVDLTLAGADGRELDLGTPMNASPEQSDGACCTAATYIPAGRRTTSATTRSDS